MHPYAGIDATDNLESHGSGHRARQLGAGGEMRRRTNVDVLAQIDSRAVEDPDASVDLGPWPRPVRIGARAGGWRVLARERVQNLRR